MARNPDLEAAILASDDPQAYLVYADWLQSVGDPRGELAVLQHRESDEAKAFLDRHAAAFLGGFASATPFETFELTWRCGFIQTATIGWELFSPLDHEDPPEAQLQRFLELESARFVEQLSLGPCPGEDELDNGVLAAAIEAVVPPNLRRLMLGDTSDWDISSTHTRIPANAAIRNLRELELRGGWVDLGSEGIVLPELRSFTVESGSLTEANLRAIAAAQWPKLEALEIWFGDPNYGAKGGVDEIRPILDAKGLPALRRIGLRNCAFADALVHALISSPVLRQVRTLDLSMGNLSDVGLREMLDHRDAFTHLDSLHLDDNALTNAHWPAARELAKEVVFGNRHDPERAVPRAEGTSRYHRYVSVGE